MSLPFDILSLILARPEVDRTTLLGCSLVNKQFNHAASEILYRKVVLSPKFYPVLDLRDSPNNPQYNVLQSSSLPRYAGYVSELVVSGYLSSRPPPRNPLGLLLSSALRAYTNLCAITLTPQTFHPDVFSEVLNVLKDPGCPALQSLTVNTSCTNASQAHILTELESLQELGLEDATRAVLQLLPEWLGKLSTTLVALHLRGNCGSITPGVLRSFLPSVCNIRSLSLGLSYSLTNEDVFTFLGQLPHLETLCLQYYLQLRSPPKMPALPSLRSFTARYQRIQRRRDATRLCVWIRRAVARSPLAHLRLLCEPTSNGDSARSGANVSFDSLVDHLASKHSQTLRSLHMTPAFIGSDVFQLLCVRCVMLEEISVSVGIESLLMFKNLASSMKSLHTARFDVRNIKQSRLAIEIPKAAEIIEKPQTPALRCLSVNHVYWEGSWVCVGPSDVRWVVLDGSGAVNTSRI